MKIESFKPMLAASMKGADQSIETIEYPLIASPKLDGIRCVVTRDGQVLSRSLKPIPNMWIQNCLRHIGEEIRCLDGELMVEGKFQDVTSAVMGRAGKPKFTYMVFDSFLLRTEMYSQRIKRYQDAVRAVYRRWPDIDFKIEFVPTVTVASPEALRRELDRWLAEGYEGAIVRCPWGEYKYGRSTWKEGGMIKVKPLEDAEATVVGFEEQMENTNEATTNELGRSKRSSSKAGKVGKRTLGALTLNSEEFGEFSCGTGMDDALRREIWDNMAKYFGQTVTFTFQRIGTKDKPRIPVFKAFRKD